MPKLAANLTMLFGRLRDYKLRMVRGVRILRADERFLEKLQIGFMGYVRVDGKLLRPTSNPLSYNRIKAVLKELGFPRICGR